MDTKDIIDLGYYLAMGFSKYIIVFLVIFMIIAFILNIARRAFGLGLDDSDLSSSKRSGLVIYTDYKTGVQYVATQKGGLTVRVDENNKPILKDKPW